MKGFFTWFKGSTKLKRWIFLILIGIALSCYGFAEILVSDEMRFEQVAKIAVIFVFGFVSVVLGIIFIQKRTLELVIEADAITKADKVDIKSLIFNKNIYDKGPNIVVIGGGVGIDNVLRGIKKYSSNITAIVPTTDYGVNSRASFGMIPLDDVKSSFIALSKDEEKMKKILDYKFRYDRLADLNFGDVYLSAMQDLHGNIAASIEESSKVLNITGKVLPVTLDKMNVCAELKDGTIIQEKSKIREVVSEKISPIQRINVTPTNSKPAPGVLEAIKEADAIIIGPGSLYTNVIPNLLIKGVAKEVKESKAIKIYISNIMTEPGQTENYGISDHIDAIVEHVGKGVIDFCICDTGEIIPEYIRRYNLEGADLVDQDIQKVTSKGINIIKKDISKITDGHIRHDPDILAAAIIEIICTDLRFKDKQTDPQYILLNSKLKTDKQVEKNKNKEKKKVKRIQEKENRAERPERRQSKFSEKYKDRIVSIQTTEQKIAQNRRTAEKRNKRG